MPTDTDHLDFSANSDALTTIIDCASHLGTLLLEYGASSQQAQEQSGQADQALLDSLIHITTAIGALDEIRRNGQKISEIVEVVKDISFQSRILSLNAAVEAAHAGEAGKGFAIVAEEVRNLANRSAEASRDIKSLTAEILDKIEEGSDAVDETAGSIAGIRGFVEATRSTVTGLVESSGNQNTRLDDLLNALAALENQQ